MTVTAPEAVRRLLQAIVWGEHLIVWDLLSPVGREHVLEAGERKGLDPVQAARLRLETSPPPERDAFLTGLVRGLRVDFSSVELEEVLPVDKVIDLADGRCEVTLECPANFGEGRWAAGSVILSEHPSSDGETIWRVDRIKPLVSRSE